MSYIGNNLENDIAVRRYEYTATAGQTTFPAVYNKGVEVYIDGVCISNTAYDATDGISVVFNTPCTDGQLIFIKTYYSLMLVSELRETVIDNTSSSDNFITFTDKTSGPISFAKISSTKLKFKPSNGLLSLPALDADSGTIDTFTSTTANITTDNVTTANITTANIITDNVTTANITTANIITDNVTTLSVSTQTTLPANTSIGNVSSTEIGYLDGVTSSVQTQLDSKPLITSGTTQPSGKNGDIFINSSNNYIYIYASGWKQVFPATYS